MQRVLEWQVVKQGGRIGGASKLNTECGVLLYLLLLHIALKDQMQVTHPFRLYPSIPYSQIVEALLLVLSYVVVHPIGN